MSRKRFKALIAAVLLAFALSIVSPSLSAPPVTLVAECDMTASGCN